MTSLLRNVVPCYAFLRHSSRLYCKSNIINNVYLKKINTNNMKYYNISLNCHHCVRFLNISSKSLNTTSTVSDLFDYIQKENRIYLNVITNYLNKIIFDDLTEEQIISLLECCGKYILSGTLESHNELFQQIYKRLIAKNKITLNIYHTYIKICTKNGVILNHKAFLESMLCEPNQDVYKALLENVCEQGDTNQSVNILYLMKNKEMAADEDVFNALVLTHTIKGGLKDAESVQQTMKNMLIPETENTRFALYKGVTIRNDDKEFDMLLRKYPMKFDDDQLLKILEKFAMNDNHSRLLKMAKDFDKVNCTTEFILKIDYLCLHLINMNHPESAMLIYKSFVEPNPEKRYGHFLLKEMMLCNTPIDIIIKMAKYISQLNPFALENVTEVALRLKNFEIAWKLFKNLTDLRPHYFWSLIIDAGYREGEPGVINIAKQMLDHKVKIDSETLENYILPYCKLNEPQLLIRNLQNFGFTVKELLTPVVVVLLQNRRLYLAYNLFQSYNVQLSQNGKLLKLLSSNLKAKKDIVPIVNLLQSICETNVTENDLVGEFLMRTFKQCTSEQNFELYLLLVKELKKRKLRLTPSSVDTLSNLIPLNCPDSNLASKIKDAVDSLQDFTLSNEISYIQHPRNMTLEQLECHLIELKNKSMETRGVLRLLIQTYAKLGNIVKVEELRNEFIAAEYKESPGMKSAMMHSYIQGNHLDPALILYEDLKQNDSQFKIDDFKIIDLVTLMVIKKMVEKAFVLLKNDTEHRTVVGGKRIERNCWSLLGSYEDEKRQIEMFNFLVKKGYCKPTNCILGPLIRIHLNKNNIEKAAEIYMNLAEKYNCTPLQLEVLCAILELHNHSLFEKAIETTIKVHGKIAAYNALVAALCEKGLVKPLRNFLLSGNVVSNKELQKRYERWINEGKVNALLTLLYASRNLSSQIIDSSLICQAIMKIYCAKNDCENALEFYENLVENEQVIDKSLENSLVNLLRHCKYEIPKNLRQ